MSNVEDDNNQREINTNHLKYNTDDDDISELHTTINSDNSEGRSKTQTVVSESCNTFFNKLNQNKSSRITCNEENESLPKTIVIPNIITTTSVEPAMSTDGNKNNVIADIETIEDNINPLFTDENLMKFVFHSIGKLEVQPKQFMEYESFLKSSFQRYSFSLKYNHFEHTKNYVKVIQMLFENDDTILLIQNKMEETFPLETQYVIIQDDIVVFVPESECSLKIVIKGGSCILNDKMNTSLTNDYETTENELENMKVD